MATSSSKTIGLIVIVFILLLLFFKVTPFLMFGVPFFVRSFSHMNHMNPVGFGGGHFGSFQLMVMWILPFILLALWMFVIIWVYRDAEKRNMNGILWGLLVFIGNFIGLLIYLIVRNEGHFMQPPSNQTTQPCLNCGKSVSDKYAFCPHCGAKLKSVCPSCEKPVSGDWQVCPYCGEKLTNAS